MDYFHSCFATFSYVDFSQDFFTTLRLVIAKEADLSMATHLVETVHWSHFFYVTHMFKVFQTVGSDCHIHTKSHFISFSTLNCFSQV